MIYAFTDSADGYYQCDVPDGDPMPAWTESLTPCAVQPATDPQVILAAKKTQLRNVREGILNRLSGIALAAQLTGDTATTAAYIVVRQGLLDITENLPADETVDAVVMYKYAALVGACTPSMIAAFAQVDA